MSQEGQPREPRESASLTPDSARALDALVDAGWRGEASDPVARLLGLLTPTHAHRDRLADEVVARVLRRSLPAELHPEDKEAVDAWVMGGYAAARTSSSLRERARRAEALAALVTTPSTSSASPGLADRVLRRIAEADAEAGLTPGSEDRPLGRIGRRFRLADLVSVAAVVLIGASIVWPMLSAIRNESRRTVCVSNLRDVSRGFSQYAGMFGDSLPVVASPAGDAPWWEVGRTDRASNSASLYELARSKFTRLADLACPGNPHAPTVEGDPNAGDWGEFPDVSYSYRIVKGGGTVMEAHIWNLPPTGVLLSDRSPVIARAVAGDWIDPMANSANHGFSGQHVLRVDGSTEWLTTPVLTSGDNIWLPRNVERQIELIVQRVTRAPLKGTERPAAPDDAFVGP